MADGDCQIELDSSSSSVSLRRTTSGSKTSDLANIDAVPLEGQTVVHDGREYTTIKEGLAYILIPPNVQRTLDTKAHQANLEGGKGYYKNAGPSAKTDRMLVNGVKGNDQDDVARAPGEAAESGQTRTDDRQAVFYNEIQQYNRDLSVLAIKAFGEDYLERVKTMNRKQKRENGIAVTNGRKRGARGGAAKRKKHGAGEEEYEALESNDVTREHRSAEVEETAAENEISGTKRAREPAGTASQPDTKRTKMDDPISTADVVAESSNQLAGNEQAKAGANKGKENRPSQMNAASAVAPTTQSSVQDVSGLDETEVPDEALIECERSMNQKESMPCNETTLETKESQHVPFKILDALSATGLRALRYSHELPFVTSVVANDLSPGAVKMIRDNTRHNNLADKIQPRVGNAISHMYQFVGQEQTGASSIPYHVIDLDPYGSAAPFLDAAIQAIQDGGLLCVTCTDAGVLMSTGYPEKAFSLYGGTPVKGMMGHEGGLRLILHSIATIAARHGISVEPLLSLSIDFYARVFVRLRKSPAEVKFLAGKTMLVYNCDSGCHTLTPQWIGKNTATEGKKGGKTWKHGFSQGPSVGEFCGFCGFKHHVSLKRIMVSERQGIGIASLTLKQISGPMWGGPLHNPAFIERILGYLPNLEPSTYATIDRIEGMLTTALEETSIFKADNLIGAPVNGHPKTGTTPTSETPINAAIIPRMPADLQDHHPFYFSSSVLAKTLKSIAPSEYAVRGALKHAGFKVARTHASRGGIKTDAPWIAIWHIMREWVRQYALIKKGALKEGQAGWKILGGPAIAQYEKDEEGERTGADGEVNDAAEKAADKPSEVSAADGHGAEPDASGMFKVIFDENLGKDAGKRLKRYQLNPRANWGPMVKAKAVTR